jgi:hypothetical protein
LISQKPNDLSLNENEETDLYTEVKNVIPKLHVLEKSELIKITGKFMNQKILDDQEIDELTSKVGAQDMIICIKDDDITNLSKQVTKLTTELKKKDEEINDEVYSDVKDRLSNSKQRFKRVSEMKEKMFEKMRREHYQKHKNIYDYNHIQ